MKAMRAERILTGQPTMEGAGVRLRRLFADPAFDPFLLLDDFGSDNPDDYLAGFPWHPHRGIETVTYILEGRVEHGDSMGNKGVISSGDAQWMTAGSGVVHQEMPQRYQGRSRGYQLWVNLPASHKMMKPRYRDIRATDIPVVTPAPGTTVRIISGEIDGVRGPVRDIVVPIEYLDVSLQPGIEFTREIPAGFKTLVFIVEGTALVGPDKKGHVNAGQAARLSGGDTVRIRSDKAPLRFLLLAGKPIGEPVAWGGPIVMNTDEELDIAFEEYRNGTFIKT